MHVIVVGAGPSGLLLSLLLARASIRVTLVEASDTIDTRPRAAHYGPGAVRVLAQAGVLKDVRSEGFIPNDMCWRRIDGSVLLTLHDAAQKNNPDAMTVLHIADLLQVLLNHVNAHPDITVMWNHTFVDLKQDDTSVTADFRLISGEMVQLQADYLCGCDGGASQVRRALFGGGSFEGKTWDAKLIATNVYYPGFAKHGYNDMNFTIHPEHYYMAARITKDGLWRVSYGVRANMTDEEVNAGLAKKYETMLPGHPKPGEYNLVNWYGYRQHQRCAPKFRVGRVCLAADAAHVCNPWGGLGLTGGIVDVGGLAECLDGINTDQADDKILDKYDEIRRNIYHKIISPVSSANFLRVSSKDPDQVLETDEGLKLFERANHDPDVKKQVDAMAYGICHDFKQYYSHPIANEVDGQAR